MKKIIILLGVIFFGAVVYAATEKVEFQGSQFPTWFNKGIYVGPLVPSPAGDKLNKITRVLSATATIDFASATITCRDSAAIVTTGAQIGDPCFVGMPETLTAGGTGLHETFSCYVSAADAVKVRACAAGTADDPASVVFKVRVVSNL